MNKYSVNEPQKRDIEELIRILPGAHETDIKVRIDGQDKWFEGDFLLSVLKDWKEHE